MFRTQGGDFGFPWPASGRAVERAKKHAKELFFNNKWPKQIYPLSWLIEKFWPVYKWTEADLKAVQEAGKKFYGQKGISPSIVERQFSPVSRIEPVAELKPEDAVIVERPRDGNLTIGFVYYTHHKCDEYILRVCQKRVMKCANGREIISVSLRPIDFGKNIVLDLQPGYLTMFKQILAGIEASSADLICLIEHDVLYHPSHFNFIPPEKDRFFYDENRWFVDYNTGRAVHYRACSTSMLCAYRELLLTHYKARVARVEKDGFTYKIGFEPGNHPPPRGVDNYGRATWFAEYPCIDIRHSGVLTRSKWSTDDFRDKTPIKTWKESDEVPGWGIVKGRMKEIMEGVDRET
jgi:hypothetical protein